MKFRVTRAWVYALSRVQKYSHNTLINTPVLGIYSHIALMYINYTVTMNKQMSSLRKISPNTTVWYIHGLGGMSKVIEMVHVGCGLCLIDQKYESMNLDMLVYTNDPRKNRSENEGK